MSGMHMALNRKPFVVFSSNFGGCSTNRDHAFLDLFLAHGLYIDTVEHGHLSGKLFREFNIILLFFAVVIEFDGVESLVQVLKQLSIFLPGQESRD